VWNSCGEKHPNKRLSVPPEYQSMTTDGYWCSSRKLHPKLGDVENRLAGAELALATSNEPCPIIRSANIDAYCS